MSGHIVAVDLGSSGVKVAIVDETGNVLAAASALLPTTFGPGGSAEQDPEQWWTATGECSRRALAESGVAARDVEAVTVTAQYMSIVPIDTIGRPVGNTIMWMDKRGRPYRQRGDMDAVMMQLDRHGLPPSANDDQAHIAVFRALHPELDEKVAAYVEPVDYLNARLTERITANQTTAFPLMVIDNRTYGSTTYSDELIAVSALDPAKLPPLIPYDEIIGHVTPAAADNFGITTDAVVVNGTIDSITSAVGSGALDSSSCSIIVGTTTVIVTHVDDKRADLDHSLISVPSPVPGKYFIMAENGVGGRALDAFLHEIVYADDAFDTGAVPADAFQRAEAAAASVPAGSGGVLYFPWLVGSGAPYHDDHVRGGFVNVSLTTTRAHLTRAVLEGVALNAAALLPHVAKLADANYDEVSMGGGGASSDLWAAIMADTLASPCTNSTEPEPPTRAARPSSPSRNSGESASTTYPICCGCTARIGRTPSDTPSTDLCWSGSAISTNATARSTHYSILIRRPHHEPASVHRSLRGLHRDARKGNRARRHPRRVGHHGQ
jgi:xylulokinase